MIGEILAKGLVVIKGDTSHARAEVEKLSATEQRAAKERIKAQEESNAAYERSAQKFALMAAGGVAAFSILSSGVKKYEEHLKSLGVGGQAELKKITDAQKQLSEAQDTLLIAIGKLAIIAAPAATELAKMADSLAGIVTGIGNVIERAKHLPGAGAVGTAAGWAWKGFKYSPFGGGLALGAVDLLGGGPRQDVTSGDMTAGLNGRESAGPGEGEWSSERPPQFMIDQGLIRWDMDQRAWIPTPKAKEVARKRSGRGGPRVGIDVAGLGRSLSGYLAGGIDAVNGGLEDFGQMDTSGATVETMAGQDPTFALKSSLAAALEAGRAFDEQMKQLAADKEESMLTRLFGPIEEFDLYANAFGTLKDATSAAMQAWIDGSMGVGEAIRKSIAQSLTAQAVQLAGLAIVAGAHGIYHLATGNPKGIGELAAAGKAAAGAVALGALAKSLGGGGSVPGGSSNANAAAGLGGGSSVGGQRQSSLTVVMGDQFAGDSPRYVARKMRRNIDRMRNFADYEAA